MGLKDEFETKIGRLTKSKAYLDFCEEVYGYRMYLFNMLDKEQLDFVFNSIPLTADDNLLDLGCGSGNILNYLVNKYGCSGTGIDLLENAALAAKSSRSVSYIKGDIDSLPEYQLNPSVVLSVDSLYFSKDLSALLCTICSIQNCRKYLFYSQYRFEETYTDTGTLQADNTRVSDILYLNGFSYEAINYSRNEQLLYDKCLTALEKRKEDFRNEGNADLYESKFEETMLGKRLYDKGHASRFLYIIK